MSIEKNCLVAQSGGPTTVINSSLAGVISAATKSTDVTRVYGALNGIQGVLIDHIVDVTDQFENNEDEINLLKNTPSMYLGSCRYKLKDSFTSAEDYKTIFERFKEYNIKYFFYIGGNDSMDTVSKLSQYAKEHNFDVNIVGVPKTIDNDLMCIDHTPGFGSAAKYIASSVLEVAHDTYIYNTQSVSIIEIMGRNAGWLTASSVLARNGYSAAPHLIYLPEVSFSTEQFIKDLKSQLKVRNHVVIAVSEGIKDDEGQYISAKSGDLDQFGHAKLCGTGKYLEQLVENEIGCKVRSIELNVLQRCAAHLSSLTDLDESFTLGSKAVEAATKGETGVMVTHRRINNVPYTLEYSTSPITEIANKEKMIPLTWISDKKNNVTEEMVDYLKPLIEGEVNVKYKNGLPCYMAVHHLTN